MDHVVLNLSERHEDSEGTVKYLWALEDNRKIETVYFSHHAGPGQCLSTQTGCTVGCVFCATALQRPARNLTADEIVLQAELVDEDFRSRGIEMPWRFVTLSGMGEPMLNYDNVVEAARRLYEWTGIEVVSATTSGIVPRIYQLAEESTYIQLHVSLHATQDETRKQLIPISRKWSIAEVLEAATYFARTQGRRVIVNYLLFEGINDSDDDARRLIDLLDPELFEVHFLLWNEIEGFDFRRISDRRVAEFNQMLEPTGLMAKPMPSKGRDIQAGCGQLLAERPRPARSRVRG
ncbi:radical SAM protein [Kutzneria sp. CA-103260]|uniref:radical SAM protein n=1 Tax=Kutzneria sp. CA-103260 TaxID=2802641 RepID=UPI001BA723A4|nr:radical SAM protein [Kutzneria sp. CA-103260]QUQ68813.1 23S rRNA (adenine(2503)-C(2))-methyltransferase RlmN [Kutzneria sp. CA-103260]